MFVCFVIFVCALSGPLVTAHHVMTGQPHEVPVNRTDVLTAARFAVLEFNRANAAEEFNYAIVNITSAKIQVVAGINYILDMHLGRTLCKRNDTADRTPCVIHSDSKELLCHFIVTDIPWEYSRVLTRQKCHRPN
ncbi:cystatin-like [Trematomus bernacchii]|uniref:cystatin-like n=1 Tax=Trematomus bernacchii TaxID=40690 RepID=UPI00146CDE5B|nr:cystatin-like [Trematomus bernacchii]